MKEILTRDYVVTVLVSFLALVFFLGILKSVLLAVLIAVVKYFVDKYLMTKLNPYIDKLIEWIKSKFAKKEV